MYDPINLEADIMSRMATEDNERMAQRVRPDQKRLIMRAAALSNKDLSQFVVENSIAAARTVIEREEHLQLSGRDSLRVLDALENPPIPNERMMAALRALPRE